MAGSRERASGGVIPRIEKLQCALDELRRDMGVTDRGEVLYMAHTDLMSDRRVVVQANGIGGATCMVMEGNYPVDYLVISERFFGSEAAAISWADKLACD